MAITKDNLTPEEKLLKLIRKEKRQGPEKTDPSDAAPTTVAKKANSKISLSPKALSFLSRLGPFKHLKIVLRLILGISLLYLIITLLYPLGIKKIKLPNASNEKIELPEATTGKEEVKPYEFYSEASRQRQIFSAQAARGAASSVVAAEAQSVKDINLIGIISGDMPQAIIEDRKTQKTYYVTEGQSVGEFQISDIQDGKIIIDYRGQSYEVHM